MVPRCEPPHCQNGSCVPPFPYVRESLERLSEFADIVIVSATPREALLKEWHEHGLDRYIALLGAQEDGSKKEIISKVKVFTNLKNPLCWGTLPGIIMQLLRTEYFSTRLFPMTKKTRGKSFTTELLIYLREGFMAAKK